MFLKAPDMDGVRGRWRQSLFLILLVVPFGAKAQSNDPVRALAQREKQPLLDTLKALVEIESPISKALPVSVR